MTAIPSDMTTEAQVARVAIADILDGNPPNGADPAAMGPYSECYREMAQAHAGGGTEAARVVFAVYAKADRSLATLIAAGDAGGEAGELGLRWQLRTLRDAYQPRSPLDYVVDGLVPRPSLSIIYGPPGSLKSMLLGDLCACIAGGLPWLEPLPGKGAAVPPLQTTEAPILWIDLDNGPRRSDERFEALGRGHGLPEDAPFYYISMPSPWPDASQTGFVEKLAELAKGVGAGVLVIDNLGLITGDTEENSGGMAQVMGNLRRLCEDTNLAVILIHHQRKSGSNDKGIRKGETLRGHSSIEAALDLALLVERKGGEDKVAVVPTKVRGYNTREIYGATFTYEHRVGTHDLYSARFLGSEAQTAKEQKHASIKEAVKEILRMGPKNQKDLVNAVRDMLALKQGGSPPGVNLLRGLLEVMVKEGTILGYDGDRKERLYRLA